MAEIVVDEQRWPVVVVRWPTRATLVELRNHFDVLDRMIDRDQPFAIVVDLRALRSQTVRQRCYAAARIARLTPRARSRIVSVAHVADHWLPRAVLSTVFWMVPSPFATRDVRDFDDGLRWVRAQLAAHRHDRAPAAQSTPVVPRARHR